MIRWHRLLRRSQMEEQLEKELRFHLDQGTADLIARGYLLEEARRQARLALGGPEQAKEECLPCARHSLVRKSITRRPLCASRLAAEAGVTVPMREDDNELGYWTTPAEPPRNQKPLALAKQRDTGLSRGHGHPAAQRPVLE